MRYASSMPEAGTEEGQVLWQPTDQQQKQSRLVDYMVYLERTRGLSFSDYGAAYAWSVSEVGDFWTSIAEYFAVKFFTPGQAGPIGELPVAHWFSGARLNYAEHALRLRDSTVCVVARNERGQRRTWTRAELADAVARARSGLRRLGVSRGDRVAALLPNSGEALIAFLASR